MKIKTDFVTNSSSTSFILNVTCSGFIPNILPKSKFRLVYDRTRESRTLMDKFVEDVFVSSNYFKSIRDKFSSDEYLHLVTKVDYGDFSENYTDLSIFIHTYYDHHLDSYLKTIIELGMKPELLASYEPSEEFIIKILKEIINRSKVKIPHSDLYYVATPSRSGSGGWNGGDPNGKYETTPELLLNETKAGMIIINNNKITSYIKSLKENFSVINDLSNMLKIKPDFINKMENNNDKDSKLVIDKKM